MPTRVRSAASLLGALLVFLVPFVGMGCSTRSDVLAVVGSRTLAVREFEGVARRVAGQYPPLPPDSLKNLLYQDLLRRALLIEYAKRSGVLVDSLVERYQRTVESEVLQAALLERLVPRNVPVSEAEVRTLYEWRDSVSKLQLIYAPDPRTADHAMAAIRRGDDFTDVANRVNLAGLLPPGGILDFLPPGALVNPLDEILRTGRPGQIIGPVQAPGEGWFIARVLARQPRQRDPWEQEQVVLAQTLQQRKRRLLSVRAFETLRDAYRVETDARGVRVFFSHQNHPAPPPLTAQDLQTVLARHDDAGGGRASYLLADALADLETDPRDQPNPSLLPSYVQWIESRVVRRVAVIEARRRHLQEEPEMKTTIEQRVDNYLLEGIYELTVVPRATVGPEDMQAAYQRRASSFMRLQSAKVQHVVIPDSIGATRVIELARRAPTLREAILLSSPGMPVREEEITFPNATPPWDMLEFQLRGMSPGSFGEPLPFGGGWMAFQLIAKQQSLEPLESLPVQMQEALRSEAIDLARERRLQALTDSLRHVMPIREYRERLKRVPWPEAGGGSIGLPG